MAVTLEGPLDLRSGGTVGLELDVAKILGGLDPAVFGESTHSREGDPRAAALRTRVEQAFRLIGVKPEVWQDPAVVAASPSAAAHGTPYSLQFSRRLPPVKLPADNRPTLEGVDLGRALFHDARLSVNNTQSCASCHDQRAAFADAGKRFSLGADGLPGKRNAMPLFNLAWQAEFFWDGRTRRLRDQVLEPIQDPLEMHQPLDQAIGKIAADPAYAGKFEAAFGAGGITAERLGLALEQFLLTQVSQDSKFDQALRGAIKLTPVEQRGLELFVTEHDPARNLRGADCFHCHGGALFSNQAFANNGLDAAPLPGRQAVTGLGSDAGKFRVPPLRNIAVTGPYMHDGRFATLEEVIDHYDHGVQRTATLDPNLAKHPAAGLGLGAADKAALIAFLHTLTDQAFLRPVSISAASLSKP
jgi:cytochrome c peroxidase